MKLGAREAKRGLVAGPTVGSWAVWAKRPGGLAKLVGQSRNRNREEKWKFGWVAWSFGPESRIEIYGLQNFLSNFNHGFGFKSNRFNCFQNKFELNSK
jgi:hypothetical protein